MLTFFRVKSLGRSVSSISLSPRCWDVWTEDLNPSNTPLNVNFFILVLATFHNSFSFFGSMVTNFICYLQHLHKIYLTFHYGSGCLPSFSLCFESFAWSESFFVRLGVAACCRRNMRLISVNSVVSFIASHSAVESPFSSEWYIMDFMLLHRHCQPILAFYSYYVFCGLVGNPTKVVTRPFGKERKKRMEEVSRRSPVLDHCHRLFV